MSQFEKKCILITGGSTGIGRATALAFAAAGGHIVIGDVNAADGVAVVETIKAGGGDALFVPTDVSDSGAVQALVKAAVETFGKIDVAFNNAGISGEAAPLHEMDEANWERVIGINLGGVWRCMKYEIQAMLQSGGGVIINTSSVLGLVGTPFFTPYVAAKHGVMGLTRSAAQTYARQNIRINAINPGWVRSNMTVGGAYLPAEEVERRARKTPIGRMAEAEEIAKAVLWLASDENSFMIGSPVILDGGQTAM